MNRTTLLAFACLFTALSCKALDLTPHRRIAGVQDNTYRYYFQDGPKKIAFRTDPSTSVDGSAGKASFEFNDLGTAGMTISRSSLTPDTPLEGASAKQYQDLAAASLPSGSAKVVLEKDVPNPITINGWTSHQYVFTCSYYGASLKRSVTILNFNKKDQLIISISATPSNYDKAYARGYAILNSIYEMKPGEDQKDPGT